jgi:aspartyl-tRNA(Asn)/glutamyl-tRNA(Gln) amidotransferase subunit A
MAPAMKDDLMYKVGAALEAELNKKWQGPILNSVPKLGAN